MRKILTSLAVIASAAALAAPASSAIVISFESGKGINDPIFSGYSVIYDFDGTTPTFTGNGGYVIQSGNDGNGANNPYTSTPGSDYLSVLGGGDISFTLPAASSVAFEWGSLDSYNSLIVITLSDGSKTFVPGSLDFAVDSDGNQINASTNGTVRIWGTNGEVFTGLNLKSGSNSMEVDNVAIVAVPEASTWAMMIAGLGLVGFAMRRKRNVAVSFA